MPPPQLPTLEWLSPRYHPPIYPGEEELRERAQLQKEAQEVLRAFAGQRIDPYIGGLFDDDNVSMNGAGYQKPLPPAGREYGLGIHLGIPETEEYLARERAAAVAALAAPPQIRSRFFEPSIASRDDDWLHRHDHIPDISIAEQQRSRRKIIFSLLAGFIGLGYVAHPSGARSLAPKPTRSYSVDDIVPLSNADIALRQQALVRGVSPGQIRDELRRAVDEAVVDESEEAMSPPESKIIVPPLWNSENIGQIDALLADKKALTKLRKSTVMIKAGERTFAGFMVNPRTLITSKAALIHDGVMIPLESVSGGEQKPGKIVAYYPKASSHYRVIHDEESDLALVMFDGFIFKPKNAYVISEVGFKNGEVVVTCGHPDRIMDIVQAGVVAEDGRLTQHMMHAPLSAPQGIASGYLGAPAVNKKGEVVGFVTTREAADGTMQPYIAKLTKQQLMRVQAQ